MFLVFVALRSVGIFGMNMMLVFEFISRKIFDINVDICDEYQVIYISSLKHISILKRGLMKRASTFKCKSS